MTANKIFQNSSQQQLLNLARLNAQKLLIDFATNEQFSTDINTAFGSQFDRLVVEQFHQQWQENNFDNFPEIEIRSTAELDGANGAFSVDTNKIYISQEFLVQDNSETLTDLLLEEYGHFVDSQINLDDSPGDEGNIFSLLVRKEKLSPERLENLRSENDRSTVIIDGKTIEIESSTSVSDSGGVEGSQQTITLESTEGGTATFSYEHFTIPDNFIIRYEGNNLVQTGFVGGSRTGTVDIPPGNSDQLEVIVTTNDEGTGWEYSVTAETDDCPDTGVLNIEGDFMDDDGDGDCETDATFSIGRSDGISRMLTIEGASAEYNDERLTINGGTVFSEIGGVFLPLFTIQGSLVIPFNNPIASVSETSNLDEQFQLAGLDVDVNGLTIQPNGFILGSEFTLPEDVTGIPIDIPLPQPDALIFRQNDVRLGASGEVSFPDVEFNLLNLLEVEASDLNVSYESPTDTIQIQGRLELEPFVKFLGLEPEITADLSGDNFVRVRNGVADGIVTLGIEDIEPAKGWEIAAEVTVDTVSDTIAGRGSVLFPFQLSRRSTQSGQAGISLELEFNTQPGVELNRIAGTVTPPAPIPVATTGFFLQEVNGGVNNLAPSNPDLVEFSGGVGLSGGPRIGQAEIISLDLEATVNAEQVTGRGAITVIDPSILLGNGDATLNWNTKQFYANAQLSLLSDAIVGGGAFGIDSDFNFAIAGEGSLNIPSVATLGFGQINLANANFLVQFTNDNNLSNDFAAGWSSVNNPLSFLPGQEDQVFVGFKGFFDGAFTSFGAEEVPIIGSWNVLPDTEYLLVNANWENETNADVSIQVIDNNGNIIPEADFAANSIAVVEELGNSTNKSVIIANPAVGIWDVEVVDNTGLGEVSYFATKDSEAPTVEIIDPAVDVPGGEVTINYEAFDPDSEAEVSLFYDTDNDGFDGIQIVNGLAENDGAGSYVWNTEGVAAGEYYIYAIAMDETSPPAFSYSQGQVNINQSADLSVVQTVTSESVALGENYTYTVEVTNNGSSDATGVILSS